MMGQHSGNQDRLFYAFNLDEHMPADHLLHQRSRETVGSECSVITGVRAC